MRFILLAVVLLVSLSAAVAENRVNPADLAEIEPAALEGLRAVEFDVFLAEVRVHADKHRYEGAQQNLAAVKRDLQVGELDVDAAKAEEKAAQASGDAGRLLDAERVLRDALHEREGGQMMVRLKEQERKAGHVSFELAKAHLALAEARRDLARARALQEADALAAAEHSVALYEKKAMQAQRSYESATARAGKAEQEVDRIAREWVHHTGSELAEN